MVLALGLACAAPMPPEPPTLLLAIEFLRTRAFVDEAPLTLSRRAFRGRDEVVFVMCNFCWCRSSRSLLAKHLVHSGHSNGFSLVCDRSCLFRCSSRAKDLPQVPQTCGRGLSVFGGGNCPFEVPFGERLGLVFVCGRTETSHVSVKTFEARGCKVAPTALHALHNCAIRTDFRSLYVRLGLRDSIWLHTLRRLQTSRAAAV